MNVIVVIDYDTKYVSPAYGNLKTACEHEDYLNYGRDKAKKFPFEVDTNQMVYKLKLKRGRRKNNKITPTELD